MYFPFEPGRILTKVMALQGALGYNTSKMEEPIGLCETCRHTQAIRSNRGSVFYLCRLSFTDRRFAKYPRLPVRECSGYAKRDDSAEPASPTAL